MNKFQYPNIKCGFCKEKIKLHEKIKILHLSEGKVTISGYPERTIKVECYHELCWNERKQNGIIITSDDSLVN